MDQNTLKLDLDLPGVEDGAGDCRWQTIITKVVSGVLQIHGPILFPWQTNDLPTCVNTTVWLFADVWYGISPNYLPIRTIWTPTQGFGVWAYYNYHRRNHSLVLFYKIVKVLVAIPVTDILTPASSRTRAISSRHFGQIRSLFFPRTISGWNNLPEEIIKYLILPT